MCANYFKTWWDDRKDVYVQLKKAQVCFWVMKLTDLQVIRIEFGTFVGLLTALKLMQKISGTEIENDVPLLQSLLILLYLLKK